MNNIPAFLNTLLNKAKSLVMPELNLEQSPGELASDSVPSEPSEIQEAAVPETPQSPAPTTKPDRMKVISAVFNGLGIGLLLGILWSLSTQPVIGGVIATLSSLLALFLGLSEKYIDPLKSLRIGAFGLSAVAGVMLGLYLRINEPFAPTMRDKMDQYLEIGYSEDEARAFITHDIKADSGKVQRQSTLLFSSNVDLTDCSSLRDINAQWTMEDLNNLKIILSETWLEFLNEFSNDLEGDQVITAMITMRSCFCPEEGGSGKLKISSSDAIKELGTDDSVEDIENVLNSPDSDQNWHKIVEEVGKNFPEEGQRQKMYLSVIKVLSHE